MRSFGVLRLSEYPSRKPHLYPSDQAFGAENVTLVCSDARLGRNVTIGFDHNSASVLDTWLMFSLPEWRRNLPRPHFTYRPDRSFRWISETRSRFGRLGLITGLLLSMVGVADGQQSEKVADQSGDPFFHEKVVPVLQTHCFDCHNDQESRGGLSIQSPEWVVESGFVEAGDPASSYLMEVVCGTGDERPAMPKDRPPLSEREVAVLRQWIQSGASWPDQLRIPEPKVENFDWWSLKPLDRPALPTGNDAKVLNPIDAFVQKRLQEAGLTPSPAAQPRDLVRRLAYDLTGLPPTAEAIARYEADPSMATYRELVDHYLDSPRYGERWGRHWLDLVRYADTHGYDKDKPRVNAWPYRDYVIRSFNQDKPYSQFIREQLAGDVFYPDSADGIVGLGFIAAGPWDFIGHVEVPESKLDGKEARNLDRDEMAAATLNVFCSTTVQCARCHNHKFDPITQRHYYDLQAVFAGVDRADRPYEVSPEIADQRRRLNLQLELLEQKLVQLEQEILAGQSGTYAELKSEIQRATSQLQPVSLADPYGYHSQLTDNADDQKWIQLDWEREVTVKEVVLYPCYDSFAGIGAGFGFPQSWQLWGQVNGEPRSLLKTGRTFDRPQALPLTVTLDPPVTVTQLRWVATGLRERQDDFHLALAEIVVRDQQGENQAPQATLSAMDSIEAPVRWRLTNLVDGLFPNYGKAQQTLAQQLSRMVPLEVALLQAPAWQQRKEWEIQGDELRQRLAALPPPSRVYAATSDFSANGNFRPTHGSPRPVYLLRRGQVAQPGQLAAPGVIPLSANSATRFDLPNPEDESQRRAALADWIVEPQHPLTWRSIVNRVWLHHFGEGLVATPNDFGRMGQRPTHPELLDWLACEFRDGGQSLKQLHRLIVTSQTYRQSCQDRPEGRNVDQENRLLWRMNRRRLSAEEIRDSMLLIAGKLDLEMGGPGYQLFQIEKPEHSPHYQYHLFDPADPETHRRTVYRFVVRSQPDPLMATLDCADSSQSVPQRNQTLTALQALSLMNNQFVLVMSEAFAQRLQTETGSLEQQVDLGFQSITGRSPTDQERQILTDYARQHDLKNLCRVLFNLNEFVFVE